MKICAVVQARMNSTRLPGKTLRMVLGKPMLWHLINQVKGSSFINDLIIASTNCPKDEEIEKFAKLNSFKIYRGSIDNIVDRLYEASKKCSADVVVRIWGDCPLIDPKLIDKILKNFIEGSYEYANNFNPNTYPRGMNFEVYTFRTLERIWKETNDPFYREYPFEYIYVHEKTFKTLYDENDVDLSNLHLTVDYIEDFNLITKIIKGLYKKDMVFHLEDILEFFNKHPKSEDINKNLKRNIEYVRDLQRRGLGDQADDI